MATTYELIAKNVLGSDTSSVTFGSIPATFDDVVLIMSLRTDRTGAITDACRLRINSDSGSNYTYRALYSDGANAYSGSGTDTSAAISFYINSNSTTSNTFSSVEVNFPNYTGSTNKSFSHSLCMENNATDARMSVAAHLWSSTSAISSMLLYPQVGSNWKSGSSFYLYGLTKA